MRQQRALVAIYEIKREHSWKGRFSIPVVSWVWRALSAILITSIVAGSATAPFAYYHFGRVAPFGLIANFLAMPIVSFWTAPSAALAFILTPFGMSDIGLHLFAQSLDQILNIAEWVADMEIKLSDDIPTLSDASLCATGLAIAIGVIGKGVIRLVGSGVCLFSAAILWISQPIAIAHWDASGRFYFKQTEQTWHYMTPEKYSGALPSLTMQKAIKADYLCTSRPCEFTINQGKTRVILTDTDDTAHIYCNDIRYLVLYIDQPFAQKHCHNFLYWDAVKQRGGVSILFDRDRYQVTFTRNNINRPWSVYA